MKKHLLLVLAGLAATAVLAMPAAGGSPNGRAGTMPAFYDGQVFTINFKEQPSGGEASLLAHNGSINTIYMSDQAEAEGFMFTSVLDAIQGDGFNPLWNEVQIVFKGAPQQFTSDNEVLAAAAAKTITLVPTTEVYRCAVLGPK
jgi:hypothetical protein